MQVTPVTVPHFQIVGCTYPAELALHQTMASCRLIYEELNITLIW
jgi:hypothetical protein